MDYLGEDPKTYGQFARDFITFVANKSKARDAKDDDAKSHQSYTQAEADAAALEAVRDEE